VHVTLPRFRITSDLELSRVLSTMGMLDVFDRDRADLSGMDGGKDLSLTAVFHQAFVAVDEKGAEAMAPMPRLSLEGRGPGRDRR
jgi:serpin B